MSAAAPPLNWNQLCLIASCAQPDYEAVLYKSCSPLESVLPDVHPTGCVGVRWFCRVGHLWDRKAWSAAGVELSEVLWAWCWLFLAVIQRRCWWFGLCVKLTLLW